jgi:hypothetical protein
MVTASDPPESEEDADRAEKRRLAEKWLKEHAHLLDYRAHLPPGARASQQRAPRRDDAAGSTAEAKPGASDADDPDADLEIHEDDPLEVQEAKVCAREVRDVHRTMRAFFSTSPTDREREHKEKVQTMLRKARADPNIAPDEPVPMTLRPFDVAPGDRTKDETFVYRHNLTTAAEAKRELARAKKLPVEAVDLVMGGRRLEDDMTLAESGVCAKYVVYLRVDPKKLKEAYEADIINGLNL